MWCPENSEESEEVLGGQLRGQPAWTQELVPPPVFYDLGAQARSEL